MMTPSGIEVMNKSYRFAAAIKGPKPGATTDSPIEDRAGVVPGSVWAFCPQQEKDHKGDYHKVFNGKNK